MARPRKNPGTETSITGTGEISSTDQAAAQRATRGRKPRSVKGASGRGVQNHEQNRLQGQAMITAGVDLITRGNALLAR
jgi:hypothetical protein